MIPTGDGSVRVEWSGSGTLYTSFQPGISPQAASNSSPYSFTPTTAEYFHVVYDDLSPTAPNILFLIVDDWGIDSSPIDNSRADVSLPPMPALEALAQRGARFTQAYAQPTCSPTRAALITGRYPFRTGIGAPVGRTEALTTNETTLPEVFAAEVPDYAVGAFGKWHLTVGDINSIADTPRTIGGWPHFAGAIGGGVSDYTNWTKVTNGVVTENVSTYATTETVNDVITWVKDQADAPWFAWVAFNAAHTPFHNPPESLHSYTGIPDTPTGPNRRTAYEASLEALDTEIARLLSSVDDGNTYIILMGDNGTSGSVVQLPFDRNHSKGSLYDGGTHVPLVVAGPGVVAEQRRDELVQDVDLFASILDLAGIDTTHLPIDGQSIFDRTLPPRTFVLSQSFGTNSNSPGSSIRDARYRLLSLADGTLEFFDLWTDVNEQTNLLDTPPLTGDALDRYNVLAATLAELPNSTP